MASRSRRELPAEIWRRFMEPAVAKLPALDWTEPKELPTWRPFTRGKYSLSYVPSYLQSTTTSTETTTTEPSRRISPPLRFSGYRTRAAAVRRAEDADAVLGEDDPPGGISAQREDVRLHR